MRKHPLRSNQHAAANYVPEHGYPHADPMGGGGAFADGEESFAALFEASLKSPKKAIARRDPDLGEVVSGEVVQIGTEYAFLDIGAKAEAMLSLEELRDENGDVTIQIARTPVAVVIHWASRENCAFENCLNIANPG